MFDGLIRWLIQLVAALFVGAAIGAIAYTAYAKITASNLAQNVRSAIQNAKSSAVKKLLGRSLKIMVKDKSINSISISVLEADMKPVDDVQIEINSREGVDASVYKGMIQNIIA